MRLRSDKGLTHALRSIDTFITDLRRGLYLVATEPFEYKA